MKKTLRYFKIYTFFSNLMFFLPVLLTIYLKRGITVTDVLLIESAYYFTIFLFELPTGYLGDRIGHDKLVVIGLVGLTISYFIFAFSFSLGFIILSQVLLGIFASCISGSDLGSLSTYLETQKCKDGLSEQKDIFAIATAGTLFSYIFSGVIVRLDEFGILTFILTGVVYLIAFIFYFLFSKGKRKKVETTHIEKNEVDKISSINKNLKLDILVCGILLGILSGSYIVSQIYYNELEVSPNMLGLIYCFGSVLVILFTKSKLKFNKRVMFLMPVMFLITVIDIKVLLIIFVIIVSLIKATIFPFINNYILTYGGHNKAFNMSINSLINNLINAMLMLSLSGIVYKLGFTVAMVLLSVLTLLLILYLYNKCSEQYKVMLK